MPDVLMPRLSDTMEEGVLSQWLKHEGDQIRRGDVLAVIETDKAAMDMEAYDEGVLTRILVEEGASVPIGTPIAVIGGTGTFAPAESRGAAAPGQDRGAAVAGQDQNAVAAAPAAPPSAAPPHPVPEAPSRRESASAEPARQAGQVLASPLARKLAQERGIDLSAIGGSGPGGRIVRADIEEAARERPGAQPAPSPAAAPAQAHARPASSAVVAAAASAQPVPTADIEEIPLTTVRRLTAERLAASASEAPHFYLTVVAAADNLLDFRAQCNERPGADVKITVTDLLIRACATTLRHHPDVNASWDRTRILRHRDVGVGVAVAIDDGLIVPVIRDADRKTLTEIAREARDLTGRARARKLAPDELAGGTFTISNLGMYGIRQFTAVINPPQAAILAVGEAVRQPVVREDQITIGTTITLTLSIDHRAVDGATAAGFLTGLKQLIEQPLGIVL